jgi:hypothetical protein
VVATQEHFAQQSLSSIVRLLQAGVKPVEPGVTGDPEEICLVFISCPDLWYR